MIAARTFPYTFSDLLARWIFRQWDNHNLMWSNDYPHPNSTWPKSWEVIAWDLGHVSEGTRAQLLRENVRELYQLPAPTSLAAQSLRGAPFLGRKRRLGKGPLNGRRTGPCHWGYPQDAGRVRWRLGEDRPCRNFPLRPF